MEECEVIARVNGQVVTACEVLWQVNLLLEDKLDQIPPDQLPEVKRQLLKRHLMSALDIKILYSDFRRKAPTADLNAIHENLSKTFEEKEVPKLMKRFGVENAHELPARLAEMGTSIREQQADFYQTMIARSWINESVNINREVLPDDLLAYYREHAEEYDFPTQARWEELMVRFSNFPSKSAAYRAMAEMGNLAYRAAVAQPDKSQPAFAAIAKARSQGFNAAEGGLNDWTTKGSLADERVDEALFTVPVGQMSPILESDRGFHIVRVIERQQAGRKPFTEVQNEIRDKILRRRTDLAFADKLDELRSTARIWTVFDGDIDSVEYAAARSPKAKRR
ncbi:MAG: peptidyl-prolyl cis-trans isomerase [Planctomycetota bacterium]